MKKNLYWLCTIVIIAFLVRVYNFSFPAFTQDETRMAYRGYTLATAGKDELGRSFPLVFNSLTDYQLPTATYITALGVGLFGKSDLGARIPFILLGSSLSILIFLIARFISSNPFLWLTSSFLIAFSYPLIFLSKIPNEPIVLTFLFTLLFFLLLKKINSKIHIFFIFVIITAVIFTSKLSWLIVIPFVLFTLLLYQEGVDLKIKIKITGFTILAVVLIVLIFLGIPQAKRSLAENNFLLLSNMTIENGINKLRGQGIQSSWPNLTERIIFNKLHFPIVGFFHWVSQLHPMFYFGQFDESGKLNFSYLGAFSKILIIPFIWGLIYLVRKGSRKERLILPLFIILTSPAFFIYPSFSQNLILLTIPFVALVMSFGFVRLKSFLSLIIILIMFFEVGLNIFYPGFYGQTTNLIRPYWIKRLSLDVFSQSKYFNTAVSDDITSEILSFIQWYNPVNAQEGYMNVPYPYKFRQTNFGNIKIIGFDDELYLCEYEQYQKVFISNRDKDELKDPKIKIIKKYKDGLNQETAFILEKGICIK